MYNNKYNVGDLVQVEDCEGWYEVVDVHIYVGISKDEGNSTDITYGVIHTEDGDYLDVDEEEITANKGGGYTMAGEIKLKAMFKRGKINELLDMLNSVNALIKVVGETDEIMAEKEAIVSALQGLTAKG